MKHKKEFFDQNIINRVIMRVTDEDFDESKLNVSHRNVFTSLKGDFIYIYANHFQILISHLDIFKHRNGVL